VLRIWICCSNTKAGNTTDSPLFLQTCKRIDLILISNQLWSCHWECWCIDTVNCSVLAYLAQACLLIRWKIFLLKFLCRPHFGHLGFRFCEFNTLIILWHTFILVCHIVSLFDCNKLGRHRMKLLMPAFKALPQREVSKYPISGLKFKCTFLKHKAGPNHGFY
jgi:hypothetical protein